MNSFFHSLIRPPRQLACVLAAILLVIALANVFVGLGSSRIHSWDEARHGVSACEMMESGNYIVNTYSFRPDYWNVKPVLSFYNNMLGMAVFGKNNFGMRFFSAFCYLIVAALTFYLLWRESGPAAALAGAAAFIVSPTNWTHCFRTGDPDAAFMMFCFAAFVCLWYSRRKAWLLPAAAALLALAFLTKSFHVGVPGILAVIFVLANWKKYSWRHLLAAVAAGLAPVLIWGIARYCADGWRFFESMISLDLLGRMSEEQLTEHQASPWYDYFGTLNHYLLVIPLGTLAASAVLFCVFKFKGARGFLSVSGSLWKWAAFNFAFSFVAFSCCNVKLSWYIFPSLLYLPVVFGVFFQMACDWLREEADRKRGMLHILPPLVIIAGCFVWICVGEGKAIRHLVKLEPQRSVLTDGESAGELRGGVFCCVAPNGKSLLPDQKYLLVIRFLGGKTVLHDVEEYKNDPGGALLLCTFEDDKHDDALRIQAEKFASKHGLHLIRSTYGQALFRVAEPPADSNTIKQESDES